MLTCFMEGAGQAVNGVSLKLTLAFKCQIHPLLSKLECFRKATFLTQRHGGGAAILLTAEIHKTSAINLS